MAEVPSSLPRYSSLEEVNEKCVSTESWLVINNYVVDVQEYGDSHPGGPELLWEHLNTDATDFFQDVGHSENATAIVKQYAIGYIEKEKKEEKEPEMVRSQEAGKEEAPTTIAVSADDTKEDIKHIQNKIMVKEPTSFFSIKVIGVGATMAALAAGLYFWFFRKSASSSSSSADQ